MAHIDRDRQRLEIRVGVEVQRHNGRWSDAESAFVRFDEDPTAKVTAMNARLAWYRETYPQFTYRLVQRIKFSHEQTIVLDEADIETPSVTVPDDASGLDQ